MVKKLPVYPHRLQMKFLIPCIAFFYAPAWANH